MVAVVGGRPAGCESDGAGVECFTDDAGHGRQLVGGGRSLVGLGAHGEEPHRGVAHVAAVVEGHATAFDRVEVLGECLELVPGHPGHQGVEAHVLNVLEGAHQQLDPSGRMGAMENPQLPATTVVTPWDDEGVRSGSQKTWAS